VAFFKKPARDLDQYFDDIYKNNGFNGIESKSGEGSSTDATSAIRTALPDIFRKLNIRSILDLPCGDLNWMSHISLDGISYLGGDISESIIKDNGEQYRKFGNFIKIDVTKEVPPKVDLILSRDLLVHLQNELCTQAIRNFCASGSTWLLTTTFTKRKANLDFKTDPNEIFWRPLNLEIEPFNFPVPALVVNENCDEGAGLYADKSLGLWKIEELVKQL